MGVKGLILIQKTERGGYRPRELVKGILKYTLDKPTRFTSIDICLVGKGKCHWSRPGNQRSFYGNREVFVNKSKSVLSGRANQKLPTGTYDCSFEFFLPDDIPTSFKNKICTIKYKVVATFLKDNLFGTKNKFDAEVIVYGYVEPLSAECLKFGLEKDVFSFSSFSKVVVKAEIEKTCWNPGENIKLNVKVVNDTNFPITIKTELMKYFTYISQDDNKNIDKESVKTTVKNSPSLKERSVSSLTCVVPTLPSLYSILYSKVMIGEYKVRVTAKLPFPHINVSAEALVFIGERRSHLEVREESHLEETVVSFVNKSLSSSKLPEEDEKEPTVAEFLEKYDKNLKDLLEKRSQFS